MNYNWNWSILFQEPYFDWILSGLGWTVAVALSAWVIAFTLGSVIGVMRTVPSKAARSFATAYVELFRNVPLLVQMFLWYFALPEVLPDDAGRWLKRDLPNPEFVTAFVALGFYTASRVAEQVRAGIESIPKGLNNAAKASGLSTYQTYRHVLLPISFRIVIPPLTSEFLTIFKNSSLALTIGLLELTGRTQQITEYTFQGFEAFAAATVLYVIIALIVTLTMTWVEGRTRIPGYIGAGKR
ncbi:MAG: amino acid ABC transporter permease [Rhodomicrobium sp.]|nr:amino acid ABC transporter permease [Rhodomicrobium sp.]